MSFVKLSKNFLERSTLTLRPDTHFISSSIGMGVTGSEFVSPVRSKCVKSIVDPANLTQNVNSTYNEDDYEILTILKTVSDEVNDPSNSVTDVSNYFNNYLDSVSDAPKDVRFNKSIDMFRFDTPLNYNKNYNIKNNLRKNLIPFHRHRYHNAGFKYTNYHCLNFYTGSNIPKDSCLLYPNKNDIYTPDSVFSLDFWINPRYTTEKPFENFHAGTILHMSSSICISLVTGSQKNNKNLTNDFKILVQLSQSADTAPSSIDLTAPAGNYPNDLIFTGSQSLTLNNWHHVSLRWGPDNDNQNISLEIDNKVTKMTIPSASIVTSNELIAIGNYINTDATTGAKFFNKTAGSTDGITVLDASSTTDPTNQNEIFTHPLNAEIHNIRLFNSYLSREQLTIVKKEGIDNTKIKGVNLYDNLLFYVPPFFYPITNNREVIVTPFQTITDSTNDPFNVQFSFGVSGKMINLENFTREFIKGEYPRLLSLTGSIFNNTIQNITADEYVYHTGSIVKRNTTILPCDNGLFKPNYYPISISPASSSKSYVNKGNFYDYASISLSELIPTASLFPGMIFQSGSFFNDVMGASPENPGVAPGSVLTIAQRTKDVSSNEIVLFDISNLYYGNRIHPKSFEITDHGLTGSGERIKIKLKDNGRGSLYRADSETPHADWNCVGDILYDEGIVLVKSPHLLYYCKDKTDIKFKGEQNIHTMIINIPFEKGEFNSSSNPSYNNITPSNHTYDDDLTSIYITGVNIHDDNFNIIMKANFAQPILKTEVDEFVVRLKMDF